MKDCFVTFVFQFRPLLRTHLANNGASKGIPTLLGFRYGHEKSSFKGKFEFGGIWFWQHLTGLF